MYTSYFGIKESPFSITPDPRFLYMSQQHQEALGYLLYGVSESGGFVLLTGEVGAGKTTLCRCLLEQLPEHVDAALILNPRLTSHELVATLCDELGIDYPQSSQSLKVLFDVLNRHLLEAHGAGRRTVLIIDESQNLSPDALEQIRLLTNLETNKQKLLQIILIGQPELRDIIDRPELRQLSQRVTARFHLPPLTEQETLSYISHRLAVVGLDPAVFKPAARHRVYRHSGGVPRLTNTICDRALLGAYAEGRKTVDRRIIDRAAEEVTGKRPKGLSRVLLVPLVLLLVVAGIGGFTYLRVVDLPVAQEKVRPSGDLHRQAPLVAKPAEPVVVESAPAAASSPSTLERPALAAATLAPGFQQASTAVPLLQPPERVGSGDNTQEPDSAAPTVVSKTGSEKVQPETDSRFSVSSETANSLDELIQASPVGHLEGALNDLFAVWGITYADLAGHSPCQRATAAKLACFQGRANLEKLDAIDRPAIIELVGKETNTHFAVLVGLQNMTARVQVGARFFEVPLDELARVYTGDYLLLWHPPVTGMSYFQQGMRGAGVLWLRERLARVGDRVETAGDSSFFDHRLHEQLRAFQRDRGLEVDGIAGPITLIALNSIVNDASVPRLRRPAE